MNITRFGGYFARALADRAADLDKDGQTSLLEAFLAASHRTEEFYKQAGRLATEHALLDDNGDGLGTPAAWFRGVRAVKKPDKGATIDGLRAHQIHLVRNLDEKQLPPALRARRDELEISISRLREGKAQIPGRVVTRRRLIEVVGDSSSGREAHVRARGAERIRE